MKPKLMRCGHAPVAQDATGKWVCPICIGLVEGADIPADNLPSLQGRSAQCLYCERTKESRFDLPFFEYRPKAEFDLFYCGCRGWD